MQIREDERGIGTEFIGVCFLWVSGMPIAQCPVVGTIAFEREALAITKEVLDRGFECEVWTDTVIRAIGYAGIGSEGVGAGDRVGWGVWLSFAPLFVCVYGKSGLIEFAFEDVVIVTL